MAGAGERRAEEPGGGHEIPLPKDTLTRTSEPQETLPPDAQQGSFPTQAEPAQPAERNIEQLRASEQGLAGELWSGEGRSTGDESAGQRLEGTSTGPSPDDLGGAGRLRSQRQQERNKQAQQRYRAKRKAQFEELQDAVGILSAQVADLEHEKLRRQELELELLRLRSQFERRPELSPASAPPASLLPAAAGAAPPLQAILQVLLAAATPGGGIASSHGLRGGGLGDEFSGRQPAGSAVPHESQRPAAPVGVFFGEQVRAMLEAFSQELGHFVARNGIARLPANGAGVSSALMEQITQMVKLGSELAGLVIKTSGSAAPSLLHNGEAPEVPCIGDHSDRWRNVASSVQLSPPQVLQVLTWRTSFMAALQRFYNERVGLKLQAMQTMEPAVAGSSSTVPWAEDLLLQAAGNAGYALPAQAAAELDEVAEGLRRSVADERRAILSGLDDLLIRVLSPIQALRYLEGSHPFSWNALAFAHAIALLHGDPPPAGRS